MNTFINLIENKIAPPLLKFSQMRYVMIVQRTFVSFTGLLIIGSVFLLVAAFPITGWRDIIGDNVATWLGAVTGIGTNFISLFVVIAAAYATVEYYNTHKDAKLDAVPPIVLAVACFFILVPFTTVATGTMVDGTFTQGANFTGVASRFLGAQGVFTGLISSIVSVELYRFFVNKNLVIRLPEGVPPMVASAFIAIVPSTFVVIIWWIPRVILGFDIPVLILQAFQPLVAAGDSIPSVLSQVFMNRLLWSAGIHGANVVGSVTGPILGPMNMANLEAANAAIAAGYTLADVQLPHMFTDPFMTNYIWTGLAPVAVVLILSKSKRLKALGWLALPAAIFNIGEPIMFGLPVVLNPIMIIPWILSYMLLAIIAVTLGTLGILPVPALVVPWTMPAPLRTLAATGGNLVATGFVIFAWLFVALCFLPFVKVMDKKALAQEAGEEAEAAAETA